jgi:integration host factor subunit beta
MTKSELIEEIARQEPTLPRRDIEIVVDTMLEQMTLSLERKGRVEIRGFGTFVARPRRAREGRNPRTGAKVSVPDKHVPFFTCGKELRERMNLALLGTANPTSPS